MKQRRYSILGYRQSGNLGDAIQTYAISRLLPGVCTAVYRDEAGRLPTDAPLIVNGWLGQNPGVKTFAAAFAGIFIGGNDNDNIRWLKSLSFQPLVGARDPFTRDRLASEGISALMIGCATLTLPRYFGDRRGILHIDDGAAGCITQEIPHQMTWDSQWQLARSRVQQLAVAAAVYTTRLHVALPCLALGTPVCFYPPRYQTERFSILEHLGVPPGELVWMDVSRQAAVYRKFLSETIASGLRSPDDEPSMPEIENGH